MEYMVDQDLVERVRQLSSADKEALARIAIDSIPDEDVLLTEEQLQLLDRRSAEMRENPGVRISQEEFLSHIRAPIQR